MKTKYVKVPVSEEPNEMAVFTVVYEDLSMTQAFFDFDYGFVSEFESMDGITHYLKEVPDHSEEMLFVMKQMDDIINKLEWPYDMAEEISQLTSYYHELINKVKDNGK